MERETCLAVSGSISWTTNSPSFPVSYDVAFRSCDEIIVMSNTMNSSFEFTDLMPGRNYTIIVVSVSDIGIGFPEVRTFYIPTEQDAMLRGMYILCILEYIPMCLFFTCTNIICVYTCTYIYGLFEF